MRIGVVGGELLAEEEEPRVGLLGDRQRGARERRRVGKQIGEGDDRRERLLARLRLLIARIGITPFFRRLVRRIARGHFIHLRLLLHTLSNCVALYRFSACFGLLRRVGRFLLLGRIVLIALENAQIVQNRILLQLGG